MSWRGTRNARARPCRAGRGIQKVHRAESLPGRILVNDDDEMIRRVVGDVLELHGYQILLAQSRRYRPLEMLSEGHGELCS
jgi:PleD family two-component response regulator